MLASDILLLDLRMPLLDGRGVIRELAARKSATRVVLLTAEVKEEEFIEIMGWGVGGVVMKDSDWSLLIDRVRRVHAAEQWIELRSAPGRNGGGDEDPHTAGAGNHPARRRRPAQSGRNTRETSLT